MTKNLSLKIKVVFFDMDGTLVYQEIPFENKVYEALTQLEINISLEETLQLINKCMSWFWENNVKYKGDTQSLYFEFLKIFIKETKKVKEDEIDIMAAKVGLFLRQIGDKSVLYADSIPVLKKLKEKGYKLACVSGRDYKLHQAVKKYGLDNFFEDVISTTDANANKSDPKLYLYACEKLNIEPENVLHIGDWYEGDIVGATAANINAVLIDRDNRYAKKNLNCYVVKDLYGLLEVLEITS